MKLFSKAVQPFRRRPSNDFDFSNMNDFQFDVEGEFEVYTQVPADQHWINEDVPVNQKRRNDREEIRRRLAMGGDEENEPHDQRKLNLQTRLQAGMNLQICFMNETASDNESQCSDTESTQDHKIDCPKTHKQNFVDFQTKQQQLQAEARQALSQAKDMARMEMEVERQTRRCSRVTDICRVAYDKMGMSFPDNKRRLSRQMLTDMNIAQLQVIVNHLHTQIEGLNEELVQHLLSRDDLHMEQDSRLVDIEDLTNHLSAKQRTPPAQTTPTQNTLPLKNEVPVK